MTALLDRLGPMGARLGPGAGRFLRWWGGALASWLPLTVRRALGLGRGRLLLQAEGADILIRRHQGETVRELGRIPTQAIETDGSAAMAVAGQNNANRQAGQPTDPLTRVLAPRLADLPRWLLLPAASCLRRQLVLPAAAADRLRDVVGFEVDRQTPFAQDAVVYDARLLRRRDRDGQLEVELVVVPRSALDPQLAPLGPLAAQLAGIDVADDTGQPLGINLLPPADRRQRRDPWQLWNWALAALAVVASGLMLWQVLLNRRAAADTFEQQLAAQADAGRRAGEQRQRLVALIEGQAFLDRTRAARPTSVEVIDELTRRLPDSTYLEKLSIEDQRLLLIGLSSEAPALIGRLNGASQWRSPALAGALQPDPASGRNRFTLTAELAPAVAAPPAAKAAPKPPKQRPARDDAGDEEDADAAG